MPVNYAQGRAALNRESPTIAHEPMLRLKVVRGTDIARPLRKWRVRRQRINSVTSTAFIDVFVRVL